IDKHYRSLEDRLLAVADAIAADVKGLGAAGATLVDVEDPGLVYAPQHIELAREAYRRIAATGVPIAVQAYFFPADRILEALASFGKPDYLQKARNQNARGKLSNTELVELERKATLEWIRVQEDIGLDILVDGEMYRGDMVAYFADLLDGYSEGGLVRSYGNRYYHKPVISGKLARPKPMTVEWWQYAQSLTDRPVKGMLTGPYTMLDWSYNEAY